MTRTKDDLAKARKKKEIVLDGKTLWISDHASWRYAQRALGFPSLESVRNHVRDHLSQLQTLHAIEAAGYKITGRTVVTYSPLGGNDTPEIKKDLK